MIPNGEIRRSSSAGKLMELVNPSKREIGRGCGDGLVLRMAGDGMEPTLRPGDYVIADPALSGYRAPGLYLVRYNGQVQIKRVDWAGGNELRVWGDNPAYPPFTVARDDPGFQPVALVRAILKRV